MNNQVHAKIDEEAETLPIPANFKPITKDGGSNPICPECKTEMSMGLWDDYECNGCGNWVYNEPDKEEAHE